MKRLKELQQFDITIEGNIEDWIDVKTMSPIVETATKQAEDDVVKEMPRYSKAKNLGEDFAREITS